MTNDTKLAETAFEAGLRKLVLDARHEGVDVEGGWDLDVDGRTYTVEITRVDPDG